MKKQNNLKVNVLCMIFAFVGIIAWFRITMMNGPTIAGGVSLFVCVACVVWFVQYLMAVRRNVR